MRWHSRESRSLRYRGKHGERLVFQCDADDGRSYLLTMEPEDVAVVVDAAARAESQLGASSR